MTVSIPFTGEETADVCWKSRNMLSTHLSLHMVGKLNSLVWIRRTAFNWITACHWYSFDLSVKDKFVQRASRHFSPIWRVLAWHYRIFLDSRYLSSKPGMFLMLTNKIHTSCLLDLKDGKAGEKPKTADLVLRTIINFFLMENQSINQCRANIASLAFL